MGSVATEETEVASSSPTAALADPTSPGNVARRLEGAQAAGGARRTAGTEKDEGTSRTTLAAVATGLLPAVGCARAVAAVCPTRKRIGRTTSQSQSTETEERTQRKKRKETEREGRVTYIRPTAGRSPRRRRSPAGHRRSPAGRRSRRRIRPDPAGRSQTGHRSRRRSPTGRRLIARVARAAVSH